MERERLFNLELYPLTCVKRAVEDYSPIADINLEIVELNYVKVTDVSKEPCSPIIMDEFGNYLLQLIAAQGSSDS